MRESSTPKDWAQIYPTYFVIYPDDCLVFTVQCGRRGQAPSPARLINVLKRFKKEDGRAYFDGCLMELLFNKGSIKAFKQVENARKLIVHKSEGKLAFEGETPNVLEKSVGMLVEFIQSNNRIKYEESSPSRSYLIQFADLFESHPEIFETLAVVYKPQNSKSKTLSLTDMRLKIKDIPFTKKDSRSLSLKTMADNEEECAYQIIMDSFWKADERSSTVYKDFRDKVQQSWSAFEPFRR